mgnify:CR=1 FL=1
MRPVHTSCEMSATEVAASAAAVSKYEGEGAMCLAESALADTCMTARFLSGKLNVGHRLSPMGAASHDVQTPPSRLSHSFLIHFKSTFGEAFQ